MSLKPVSSEAALGLDKQAAQGKRVSDDMFEKLMQEALRTPDATDATDAAMAGAAATHFDESGSVLLATSRQIDDIIEQVMAHAPESEKKIISRMKEELGI